MATKKETDAPRPALITPRPSNNLGMVTRNEPFRFVMKKKAYVGLMVEGDVLVYAGKDGVLMSARLRNLPEEPEFVDYLTDDEEITIHGSAGADSRVETAAPVGLPSVAPHPQDGGDWSIIPYGMPFLCLYNKADYYVGLRGRHRDSGGREDILLFAARDNAEIRRGSTETYDQTVRSGQTTRRFIEYLDPGVRAEFETHRYRASHELVE
jgi:hypothetical protein